MGEVRDHHHNLAVEYYDYQKAYDTVRHDWMLRVHELIGIETNVQEIKCTHSLFIDDLITNQQNHQKLSISKYGYRNNIC